MSRPGGRLRAIAVVALVAACVALAGPASADVVVPDGGFVLQGSTADVQRGIDIAHDAGARWISLSATWSSLEPSPDSYKTLGGPGTAAWDDLAAKLTYAASRGMKVEIRLSDAPAWASGRTGVSDDPPTPANLPAYAGFLTDLATRFAPMIDAYSPWNEPNRAAFWNPPDADAFTALQKAAYPAIKAGDPSATVLYGPVVGRYASQNTGYTFLRRSYQLGLKGYADVIGWNGYPGGAPESPAPVEGGVPAANTLPAQLYLRDLIDQYDPGRRVWIMELSWSTCQPCNVSASNGATEAVQADYLTRAFLYRRRYLSGVTDRIFWYLLRDEGTDRTDWFQNHGVLHRDWSPKPALAAFRSLGVEVGPSQPGGGAGAGGGTGAGAGAPLPAAAARIGLPTAASSSRGRTAIGRIRITVRRGVFTLRARVTVVGGSSRIRIDGFRAKRWRRVGLIRVRRTGTLTIRVRDQGYAGFRMKGTVPGRKGFRVGRVARVPRRLVLAGRGLR